MKKLNLFVIAVALGFLSACGLGSNLELSETHEFTGFGFSIDYPEGWVAITEGHLAMIAELQSDFDNRHLSFVSEGIIISLEHRPIEFLVQLGLKGNPPTIEDLFALNIGVKTGMTNPNITETTIFGVPALRSEYYEEQQWDISYAGFIEDEAFFFVIIAPTKQQLDDFKPTWEAMLETITPLTD